MRNNGAEFRKADLQTHTPRDAGWVGHRPEDALGNSPTAAEILAARDAFCLAFVKKCIAEGLRAIAITDHHEGVYCYRIIAAKEKLEVEQGEVDLWIFPGMELTCKDACQALIIFDASLPVALFEKARAKLGLPADTRPNNSTGIQVELLDFNIADLQDLLDADPELRSRFIIFPHVKPGGHKTVLREGFHKRFKELPYVGGYMDKCYPHQLNPGDRRILDGAIPAWASEKRGVFSCSDARHADFRLIGQHSTWIKLASPTAESLRQAMLAPDCRIRYEEPRLPNAAIVSITVRGSNYVNDGTYHFNPQMNTVIGGRGAGKSTLLEYIRFGLGCSAMDETSGEGRASERLKELLQSTLDPATGAIELEVVLNGASVVLSREMAKRSIINVAASGSVTPSTVQEVRRLISTQQFRQGELSELARDDAASRLLQLVTGRAAMEIAETEAKLKKNGQSLSESLAKAVRLSAAKLAHAHADTQTKLLAVQIANLEQQLNSGALPATPAITEHAKYLQQQDTIARTTDRLRAMRGTLAASLSEFASEMLGLIKDQPTVQGLPKLLDAFESFRASLQDDPERKGSMTQHRDHLLAWFDETALSMEAGTQEWKLALEQHQAAYDEQKNAMQGKQSVLESIEALNAQLQVAKSRLDISAQEEATLRDADDQLVQLREERRQLQEELQSVVGVQVATLHQASSGLARGQLAAQPDFTELNSAIRLVLQLPLIREARIEALASSIFNAPEIPKKWHEFQEELVAMIKWKEGAPADKGVPPTTPILQAALEDSFLEKLRERITPDRVEAALLAILRPRVELFQLREGREIEFRKASQGEQAATLLNILMNHSNGPLIIDQPEEDLDNRIINDIIRTIRITKAERQLIFATHNANIAVNGDSENVLEMVLGEAKAKGAIDDPDVRTAITNTMEGGKDAFELRRKKYNF